MVQTFLLLAETARPRQWLKNASLFTGLIFTGWLFIPEKFFTVVWAAILFSFLTSAVYIFNDIIDAPADRLHPLKKKRPIAAGKLPVPVALFTAILLASSALFFAVNLSFFFFFLSLTYLFLHMLYGLYLKRMPIIDVLTIASGFIIRVYAGAVAIDGHINVWLLLCVVSFSLFLAIGKRRSERTLLKAQGLDQARQVLTHYPETLLNIYTSMFANTTWLTYALFTFLQPPIVPEGRLLTLMSVVPRAFVNQKLLMITVPVVIYGVMRYLQLIYEKGEGESPEKILLSDKPLLSAVILWGILIIGVIYGIG